MNSPIRLWSIVLTTIITALLMNLQTAAPAHKAGPWYVSTNGDDSSNDCLSPSTPCASIYGALIKASSGDVIYVTSGTYNGNGGDEAVLINQNITLSGGWNGSFTQQIGNSIIDGEGSRRGLYVMSGVVAVADHFTVQNADSGGGIYNDGILTLNSFSVNFNLGTGIFNGGEITITDCSVSNNTDRGIFNFGILTMNNCTVNDNSGGGGGGFMNSGSMSVNNSTISGNTALWRGGGIYSFGVISLNNVTITDNRVVVIGGGGLHVMEGSVTLQNSIIAGNIHDYNIGPDCVNHGIISSYGYNIIGDTSDCAFSPITGDMIDIDPLLWQMIGIPGYHPLIKFSPAIDAGNPDGCKDHLGNPLVTDQRGVERVGRCDIGSYEYDPANDPLTYIFFPLIVQQILLQFSR